MSIAHEMSGFRAGQRAGLSAQRAGATATPASMAAHGKAKPATDTRGDDLVFAPTTTMLSIAAAIAPLLASPLVEALRTLLKL